MQLADYKKRRNKEEALSPSIYAALVDSMCRNFWPMLIGTICSALAAFMTALKTGNLWLWPCALLIMAIGTARAFQMREYERRTSVLTFEQASYWEPRYLVGAVLYAGALDGQRALVLGDFSGYKLSPADNGYDFDTMLAYLRERLPIPVLTGLPFGHTRERATLPFGCMGHLVSDADGFELVISDYPTLAGV